MPSGCRRRHRCPPRVSSRLVLRSTRCHTPPRQSCFRGGRGRRHDHIRRQSQLRLRGSLLCNSFPLLPVSIFLFCYSYSLADLRIRCLCAYHSHLHRLHRARHPHRVLTRRREDFLPRLREQECRRLLGPRPKLRNWREYGRTLR